MFPIVNISLPDFPSDMGASSQKRSSADRSADGLTVRKKQRTAGSSISSSQLPLPDDATASSARVPQESHGGHDPDPESEPCFGPSRKPSSILGLPDLVSRLPIATCRAVLAALPSADIRNLLTDHTTAHPLSRASSRLAASYDALFTPRADQLVAFDGIVACIQSHLADYTGSSAEAQSGDYLYQLETALNGKNGVFANIRLLHASAIHPASFGTKLNALKALVELIHFFITGGLLFEAEQRKVFDKGPIGDAFFAICWSLNMLERKMAYENLCKELDLEPLAEVLRKNAVFGAVVEAFLALQGTAAEAMTVQVVPVGVGEDSDSQAASNGEEEGLLTSTAV